MKKPQSNRSKTIKPIGVVLALGSSATILAGCGNKTTPTTSGKSPTAVFINAPASPFVDNFNPFSPSNPAVGQGVSEIYEPLFWKNSYTGKYVPKLAVSYAYNSAHTAITFQLRKNVKWSDGTPFTSADVVYTYDLILSHPALDLNGLSSMIASVHANGMYGVTIDLKAPNSADLYFIAADTPILPKHVWDKIANPVTYTDRHPVTTGPYLVGSFSSSGFTLVRNRHYWNAPQPYVKTISVPLYLSNNSAELAMAKGNYTVAEQFLPDIRRTLLSKNPSDYHYWFPPALNRLIFTNDAKYPFNITAFRQALSDAINRQEISTVGEYGYEPIANSVFLPPTPLLKKYIDSSITTQYPLKYSVSKAKLLLKSAGFHWNRSGNLIDPHGGVVAPTMLVPAGATDTISDAEIMAKNFKEIGINMTVKTPALSTILSDLDTGSYQMIFKTAASQGGPSAYDLYTTYFSKTYYKPVGQSATGNQERWQNAKVNNLLNQYTRTFSSSAKVSILDQIEKVIAQQLPLIPVVFQPAWDEYNTSSITNFPSAKNPYAAPIYNWDVEYIMAQLKVK